MPPNTALKPKAEEMIRPSAWGTWPIFITMMTMAMST